MNECHVMNVVEVLSKLSFFSTLIDRSTIHGKEKKVYAFSGFKEKNS